jgi:hypothetical protein
MRGGLLARRSAGRLFTDVIVQAVWEKGPPVPASDPRIWRKDVCGT